MAKWPNSPSETRPRLLFAILPALLLAGCGPARPATHPVTGLVTLDDAPVAGAAVLFSPVAGGRPATGVTDPAGRFELMTFQPADGALPGSHQVTVTLMETTGVQADPDGLSGAVEPGGVKEHWIVPRRYSLPATSGLEVEVTRGMRPVELKLTTKE